MVQIGEYVRIYCGERRDAWWVGEVTRLLKTGSVDAQYWKGSWLDWGKQQLKTKRVLARDVRVLTPVEQEARAAMRSIGFSRSEYHFRTDLLQCYQRNKQKIREYGPTRITIWDNARAMHLIDKLAEQFVVEVVKHGEEIRSIMVRTPRQNESLGRRPDFQLSGVNVHA